MSSESIDEKTVRRYDWRASSYEEKWSAYLHHTHNVFVCHIEIDQTDTVLDLSGGTGLLAQTLMEQGCNFGQFVINDPSEQMLAIARDRLTEEPNISFSNQRAEQIEYDAATFDAIFCLNSFHFYRDQPEVLARCHRMLKQDGKLYILDWNRAGFFRIVNLLIKWSTSDYIDTRSLTEINELLSRSSFEVDESESWRWRYWKFFFVEAHKFG